jgi:hypothetical protein
MNKSKYYYVKEEIKSTGCASENGTDCHNIKILPSKVKYIVALILKPSQVDSKIQVKVHVIGVFII